MHNSGVCDCSSDHFGTDSEVVVVGGGGGGGGGVHSTQNFIFMEHFG